MKTAKLYQRLSTTGNPWTKLELAKNGTARPHTNAVQFGIRYTLNGERHMDTIDQALTMLRQRNVEFSQRRTASRFPAQASRKLNASEWTQRSRTIWRKSKNTKRTPPSVPTARRSTCSPRSARLRTWTKWDGSVS